MPKYRVTRVLEATFEAEDDENAIDQACDLHSSDFDIVDDEIEEVFG